MSRPAATLFLRLTGLARSIGFLTALGVLTAIWGPAATFCALLRPGGKGFIRCGRRWARGLLRAAGVQVRVEGLELLGAGRSYVFMANHQSHFDVLALLHALPFDLRAVAKKELGRVPLFGWALTAAGFIMVDRSKRDSAIASLARAPEILRGGRSILLFAEGTRSTDGRLLPFKKGGFMMALAAGASVVPVAVCGSRGILPKGSHIVSPGTIEVRVRPPIETAGRGTRARDELMAEVRASIERGLR